MMKVLAGDWPVDANVTFRAGTSGALSFQKSTFSFDHVALSEIESAELVTEDKRMSVGGKLGWGIAGALLLGPIGAVIGGVAGGNKNEKIVAVVFRDGRKALLKAKAKEAEKLLAIAYQWPAD